MATDPLQFMLLQHPEKFDLHGRRSFPDLIKKKGTLIRLNKFTILAPVSTCKGTFFMPEQF